MKYTCSHSPHRVWGFVQRCLSWVSFKWGVALKEVKTTTTKKTQQQPVNQGSRHKEDSYTSANWARLKPKLSIWLLLSQPIQIQQWKKTPWHSLSEGWHTVSPDALTVGNPCGEGRLIAPPRHSCYLTCPFSQTSQPRQSLATRKKRQMPIYVQSISFPNIQWNMRVLTDVET